MTNWYRAAVKRGPKGGRYRHPDVQCQKCGFICAAPTAAPHWRKCFNEDKDEPCAHCGRRRPCHHKGCPYSVQWVYVPHIAPGADAESLALRAAAEEVHFWLRVIKEAERVPHADTYVRRARKEQLHLQVLSYLRATVHEFSRIDHLQVRHACEEYDTVADVVKNWRKSK